MNNRELRSIYNFLFVHTQYTLYLLSLTDSFTFKLSLSLCFISLPIFPFSLCPTLSLSLFSGQILVSFNTTSQQCNLNSSYICIPRNWHDSLHHISIQFIYMEGTNYGISNTYHVTGGRMWWGELRGRILHRTPWNRLGWSKHPRRGRLWGIFPRSGVAYSVL